MIKTFSPSRNLPHILSCLPGELKEQFSLLYNKGNAHAGSYFKKIYREGLDTLTSSPSFHITEELIQRIKMDFPLTMPAIAGIQEDESTSKIVFKLSDGITCETVLLAMSRFNTLCVSSQAGCRYECIFCETGRSGFRRNLLPEEIVGQVMAVRFCLGKPVRNIVFMGMGEPFDNLSAVIKAIDILTHPLGLSFPASSICISTAGHIDGINRFSELCRKNREKGYYRLRLAVSLNAAADELRNKIMPINRKYPLNDLKKSLIALTGNQQEKALFIEYVLLPGINNLPHHAGEVAAFMAGLKAGLNIIPFNPGTNPPCPAPAKEEIALFFDALVTLGLHCRVRHSKGSRIMAGCGQLGGRYH
ncbi:MAG: 23S rRNA (adenine(2503)-C(2))-methyltransferase RlmN [Spirochaetales bacterium]|nr:23S rRNA (adenine(2503)-C(2))-methyltransferase RlmN [Spirochaetales bacterium]